MPYHSDSDTSRIFFTCPAMRCHQGGTCLVQILLSHTYLIIILPWSFCTEKCEIYLLTFFSKTKWVWKSLQVKQMEGESHCKPLHKFGKTAVDFTVVGDVDFTVVGAVLFSAGFLATQCDFPTCIPLKHAQKRRKSANSGHHFSKIKERLQPLQATFDLSRPILSSLQRTGESSNEQSQAKLVTAHCRWTGATSWMSAKAPHETLSYASLYPASFFFVKFSIVCFVGMLFSWRCLWPFLVARATTRLLCKGHLEILRPTGLYTHALPPPPPFKITSNRRCQENREGVSAGDHQTNRATRTWRRCFQYLDVW